MLVSGVLRCLGIIEILFDVYIVPLFDACDQELSNASWVLAIWVLRGCGNCDSLVGVLVIDQ